MVPAPVGSPYSAAAARGPSSCRFFSCLFVAGAGSGEDVTQGQVALLTRIFEDSVGSVVCSPWDRDGPGSCIEVRILDGDLVADRVGVDAPEAFNQA